MRYSGCVASYELGEFRTFWRNTRTTLMSFTAILVIFSRGALIFFVWKLLEKYEKWHHFCVHAQWWSPWRRQNVGKGHLAPSNLTFLINCDRQKRFSQNERRRADLPVASDFLIFAQGLSYALLKFCDNFTPFFRLWKTITKSPAKIKKSEATFCSHKHDEQVCQVS